MPEDVKREAGPVFGHRILLNARSHMDAQDFIRTMLESVEVPLEKL
jgi:hypothetical protein